MFPRIQTPAVLVDLNVAEANIVRFQNYCDAHGLKHRPHIKTHKLPMLAKRQIAAGAIGITCQKISEADAMIAEGGVRDVMITYNIVGCDKLARLRQLAEEVYISVVADSRATVDGLSKAFRRAPSPPNPLTVLVECDTGAERCGVQTPDEAAALARYIAGSPGLRFGGLMTYPPVGREAEVERWLAGAKAKIEAAGLDVPVISNGGSPGMWQAEQVSTATEYRAGTYIYNDRSLVERGVCEWEDCALSVLATVVSTPTPTRAVIDAGTKVLTSDLLGLDGHGHVLGRPDIKIANLSEEHGVLIADNMNLAIGERVRIIPNHACVVSNMLHAVELVRGDEHLCSTPVTARGKVW
ncbi:D-TA family PLP-dependent enzyme [Paracoccaceae bacterium GXU_MW_L88]